MADADVSYAEHAPPPGLATYVRCLWRLRAPAGAMTGPEPIIPDGRVEVVLNFGDPFVRHVGASSQVQPHALVAGQITRSITIQPSGRVDLWGIRFHAWGAAPFFDVSGDELSDQFLSVAELAPQLCGAMPAIADRSGELAQYDQIVTVLTERLRRARTIGRWARDLIAIVTHEQMPMSVRAIAAHAGVSMRRVQTIFRDDVGLSPKQLLRITRFQRALHIRRSNTGLSWSAIAARAGYYDHAHLVHDANAIAGCAPSLLTVGDSGLTDAFLSGVS